MQFDSNVPLVSIAIITYNQEEYIEKAILSVLNQKINFNVELIIGEDCSTDSTVSICREYKNKYPDFIRVLEREENLGYIDNLIDTVSQCRGQYIALLEADDYWVSSDKLAIQVRELENNQSLSLCFTNSEIDDKYSIKKSYFDRKKSGNIIYTYADVFKECVVPTSTIVFRKIPGGIPSWFSELITYEYALLYYLASFGDVIYLNEITACRTQHYRGISITRIDKTDMVVSSIKSMKKLWPYYASKGFVDAYSMMIDHQITSTGHLFLHYGNLSAWRGVFCVMLAPRVVSREYFLSLYRLFRFVLRLSFNTVFLPFRSVDRNPWEKWNSE